MICIQPVVNKNQEPVPEPDPVVAKPSKRGRPAIHADRKAYRAEWMRKKRAADACKSEPVS